MESGLKMTYLADKLGITIATLSRKVNRKSEFTGKEIQSITSILGLTKTQRDEIFFSNS